MAESSTATEVQDVKATAESSAADQNTDVKDIKAAEPSPADEGGASPAAEDVKPKSMLDAVKAAIAPDAIAESKDAETSSDSEGAEKGSEPAKTETAEESKVEDDKLPFAKHPRWQEVLKARKAAEARVEELTPEVETFRAFKASVAEAGLQAEEIDTGFDIMRLMKVDPVKAYEKLKPYMDTLEAFMGNRLPEDLQADLDAGSISQERAQELARARAQQGFQQERSRADEARAEQDRVADEQRALHTHLNACGAKVSEWDTQWKASDPDYATKFPLVEAQLIKLNSERGIPKSVDEAVGRAKEAREAVEKTLGPVFRKTQEKRVVGGGSSVSQAAPAPKTFREAVRLAAKGQYKSAA